MTEENQEPIQAQDASQEQSQEPKKKSLAEAAKEMLAQKKKAQSGQTNHQKPQMNGPGMKSQHSNKPSMRRKMGSS